MKTKLAFALHFAAAAAASAQLATVDDLLTSLDELSWSVRTDIVIPIAGDAAGRLGTGYSTDISLESSSYIDAVAAVAWLPLGRDASSDPLAFTLATSPDNDIPPVQSRFVSHTIDRTGFGAMLVAGVDQFHEALQGRVAARANVIVNTSEACGVLATMPYTASRTRQAARAAAVGLRAGSGYRTNVGIVNLSRDPQTFTVRVLSADGSGTELAVPVVPRSLAIAAVPPEVEGVLAIDVETGGQRVTWAGWAASVQEATGDAWYEPLKPYEP